mmetsp:Transcript_42913/g.132954  ORF Transcript_42913/g.132954 Transcript_42913/m.132954 type:complete len:382 (-) Transcript_42913:445-1590(-)
MVPTRVRLQPETGEAVRAGKRLVRSPEDGADGRRVRSDHPLDVPDVFLNEAAEAGEPHHEPHLVKHHGENVDALGTALQLHGTVHELIDAHAVAAVRVEECEDDPRLAGVDVETRKVGLHPGVLQVPRELREAEGVGVVQVRLLEDAPHLLGGPPLVLREALHDLVLRPCAHCAVDKDARDDVEHSDQAEGHVEGEDREVQLPEVQEPQELPVGHPVVAAGDGAEQRDHRLIQAAEAAVDLDGVGHLRLVRDVEVVEVAGDGVVEDDAEDEDDQQDHDEGPHQAHEGVEQGEDHRPEALQGLHRAHDADDADDPEDPQDPEEGEVRDEREDHLDHGVEDQEDVEAVPLALLPAEEGPPVCGNAQQQLQREPRGEQDVPDPQ